MRQPQTHEDLCGCGQIIHNLPTDIDTLGFVWAWAHYEADIKNIIWLCWLSQDTLPTATVTYSRVYMNIYN